jgi:hypothetical protein
MSLGNGAAADDTLDQGGQLNGADPGTGADSAAPTTVADAGAGGGAQPSFTMRDFLRGREYEVPDDLHDDDLLRQFETMAERADRFAALGDADPEEIQRLAELGRQLGPYQAQIEQLRQQAQAVAPVSPGAASGNTGLHGPTGSQAATGGAAPAQPTAQQAKFDREAIAAARSTCRQNPETGLWEPVLPFYAEAAKFLNDAEQLARRNSERLLLDPDGWMDEGFTSRAEKLREQLRQEILSELGPDINAWREYQLNELRSQFIGPLEQEFVAARDAAGNPTLTPKGQVFDAAYAQAPQGLGEVDRLKYAKAMADQWELQQSRNPTPAATATPFRFTKKQPAARPGPAAALPPRDPRGRFIDSARHSQTNGAQTLPVPNRAATVRAAARRIGTREPPKSYEEIYAEEAAKAGY